jgi:hypothetical protein
MIWNMIWIPAAALLIAQPDDGHLSSRPVFDDRRVGIISDMVEVGDSIVVVGSMGAVTFDRQLTVLDRCAIEGATHPLTSPMKVAVRLRPDGAFGFLDDVSEHGDPRSVALHARDGSLLWRTRTIFPDENAYAGEIRSIVPLLGADGMFDGAVVVAAGNEQSIVLGSDGAIVRKETWGQTNDSVGAIGLDAIGDDATEVLYGLDGALVCVDLVGREVFRFDPAGERNYINMLVPTNTDKDAGPIELLVGVSQSNWLGSEHTQFSFHVTFDEGTGVAQREIRPEELARASVVRVGERGLRVQAGVEWDEGGQRGTPIVEVDLLTGEGESIDRLVVPNQVPMNEYDGELLVMEHKGELGALVGWGWRVYWIEVD